MAAAPKPNSRTLTGGRISPVGDRASRTDFTAKLTSTRLKRCSTTAVWMKSGRSNPNDQEDQHQQRRRRHHRSGPTDAATVQMLAEIIRDLGPEYAVNPTRTASSCRST